jgi:hypothetical protein
VIAFVLLTSLYRSPKAAQADEATPPVAISHVNDTADGVEVNWDATSLTSAPNSTQAINLPLIDVQGARLPARLIALELLGEPLDPNQALQAEFAELNVVPWVGAIEPILPVVPLLLHNDGTREERPALAKPLPPPTLPAAPFVLLRQGVLRGHRFAVYAFSPIFQQEGQPVFATQMRAKISGARLASSERMAQIMQQPFAKVGQDDTTPRKHGTHKLIVTKRGMQRVTGAALASAGFDLGALNPAHIRIRANNDAVALEWRGLDDGVFDANDELRFYTPEPGDRWNITSVYWLSVEPEAEIANGRMAIAPSNGNTSTPPLRTTAAERGIWHSPAFYDSTLSGDDGDHWFAQTIHVAANGSAAASAYTTMTLPTVFPLASGTISLTVFGSTYSAGSRTLWVQMVNPATGKPTATTDANGADAATRATFEGVGNWSHRFAMAGNTPSIALNLAASADDQFLLDGVAYERPVTLSFGKRTAAFWGVSGTWVYQLRDLPTQATLYDVSDPLHPVIQPLMQDQFQAGPAPQAFWLSNAAEEAQPVVEALPAVSSLDELLPNLDQIYIAPRNMRAALAPLIALRYAQKRVASIVAVEDIYDAFGGGLILPDAIRAFLRNVVKDQPALKAITLVGDGSHDPLNHLGMANPTLIPPFLADVDPWINETACDACYVQLDGTDALSDELPDLQVGRLPVKSIAELNALVNKMVAYETAPSGAWNWRSLHLADNYLDAKGKPDSAGNFPVYEETAAQQQPVGVVRERLYFMPNLKPGQTLPWQEINPLKAHERVVALFNAGGAIANFQGHGQVDRLAFTEETRGSTINYLLGNADVAALNNGHRLPILLEMACLTSAFHRPLDNAATIDEMLVLAPNGGAIATWGATGMGLAYQHDFLQRGFYTALWATPQTDATLGELTQRSLLDLYNDAACCHDALRTFVLLGDPMTVARAIVPQRNHIPFVKN